MRQKLIISEFEQAFEEAVGDKGYCFLTYEELDEMADISSQFYSRQQAAEHFATKYDYYMKDLGFSTDRNVFVFGRTQHHIQNAVEKNDFK